MTDEVLHKFIQMIDDFCASPFAGCTESLLIAICRCDFGHRLLLVLAGVGSCNRAVAPVGQVLLPGRMLAYCWTPGQLKQILHQPGNPLDPSMIVDDLGSQPDRWEMGNEQ